MQKRRLMFMALIVIVALVLGQSALAFSDTGGNVYADKIKALKDRGILSGMGDGKFRPDEDLNYASGISMIVKGLDLNINHIRFLKQPLVSEQFPNLSDNAWYSDAFIIGSVLGLDIPSTVKADDPMTKEQFAYHLFQAIQTKGEYAFIKIYMVVNDEDQVTASYMNHIQKLLIARIASVDEDGNFHPKAAIKRGEAAAWIYDSIQFVEERAAIAPEPETPVFNAELKTEAVTDSVNKVTLTADLPHPGYGLRIASIQFDGEQAIIHTELHMPDPAAFYPQVIQSVELTTYIDAGLEAVLGDNPAIIEWQSVSKDADVQ